MRKFFIFVGCLFLCPAAIAHQLSTAYFTGAMDTTGIVRGEWQISLFDLEQAVGLDADGNGKLLWLEVLNREEAITEYLTRHVDISRGEQSCSQAISSPWQLDTHFNEAYLVLPMRAQCPLAGVFSMNYSAFFAQDSQHKLLLNITTGDNSRNRVISDGRRSVALAGPGGSNLATFQEFLYQGIIHIWVGVDHILFLLSLLLTCVLTRKNGEWMGKEDIRQIVISTTWIVTAFTLAHSLTLTATALGWVSLPSRWVEVGIAVTVVIVALNNMYPLVVRLGWLTFGFGLLHGMGFAGVLGELGLPADQKVLTVLAFNLGVEVGQLAIVFVVLPLLVAIRNYTWYSRYGLPSGSAAVAVAGTWWIFERI